MLNLKRRHLFQAGAAAIAVTAAAALVPSGGSARAPVLGKQIAGVYRRKLGGFEVTSLLDGYLDIGNDLWQNIGKEEITASIKDAFLPQDGKIRVGITSYLINTGTQLVLIDSGALGSFGPTAGHFASNLSAAGVAPSDIDVVLITHMHPDHIAALLNTDKTAAFPNASVHINGTELSYWTSDANQGKAPDFAKPWFAIAGQVRAAYGSRISTFSGSEDVVPGFAGVPLPGHTPGHTGFRITSNNETLLVWGDACGVAAVQFAHPEAGLVFDVDSTVGQATRKRLLDMAASERVLIASAHLPFPTFGHVARAGSAFEWVPDDWQFQL